MNTRAPLLAALAVLTALASLSTGAAPASGTTGQDARADTTTGDPLPRVAGRRAPPPVDDPSSFTFAVLGHVRGGKDGELYYLLDDLLAKVRARDPDFVVLTGDMIWGQYHRPHSEPEGIREEWRALDDSLASLGVPVYRVPGNHDINDAVTRDVYFERYDTLPRAFDVGESRFVLLSSTWIPGEERNQNLFTRGESMSPAEIAFLEETLPGDGSYRHAFVFMHHLLWWDDDDGPWWEEVHPILSDGGVEAVFTGDYGPMKFSHRRADGIDYYQSGVAPDPFLELLRAHESHRLLAQQFDNWLFVTVDGADVRVEVETSGATASGHFTPERWRDLTGAFMSWDNVWYPGFRYFAREAITHPEGRWAIAGLALLILGLGFGGGVLYRRRQG